MNLNIFIIRNFVVSLNDKYFKVDIRKGFSMKKKIIDEIIEESVEEIKEEVMEEIKVEIRNELKENVKGKIKAWVIEELTPGEDTIGINKRERRNVAKYSIFSTLLAVGLYLLLAYLFLVGLKNVFYFLAKYSTFNVDITTGIYILVLLVFVIFYMIISFYFYRLKQNENTVLLYGAFEISFGIITIMIAGISFVGDMYVSAIKITTFIAFYGGIYVIVRGLETTKKHYDHFNRKPIIFKIDISKETRIEKILSKCLKAE